MFNSRVYLSICLVVTTMGVGELSAINGVAGSYSEQVKVIHIVGTTTTTAQRHRAMIHHCLGPNPDHRVSFVYKSIVYSWLTHSQVYEKMSAHVRATHCWLDNPETAAAEIDVRKSLSPHTHTLKV